MHLCCHYFAPLTSFCSLIEPPIKLLFVDPTIRHWCDSAFLLHQYGGGLHFREAHGGVAMGKLSQKSAYCKEEHFYLYYSIWTIKYEFIIFHEDKSKCNSARLMLPIKEYIGDAANHQRIYSCQNSPSHISVHGIE